MTRRIRTCFCSLRISGAGSCSICGLPSNLIISFRRILPLFSCFITITFLLWDDAILLFGFFQEDPLWFFANGKFLTPFLSAIIRGLSCTPLMYEKGCAFVWLLITVL